MRRQLAHQSQGLSRVVPTTTQGVLAQLAGRLHFHPCVECRRVYGCSCAATGVNNGRCGPCITPAGPGRRRSALWDESRDPRECCVDNTRQVTDGEELLRYQLAGPGPWFKCHTCARCHSKPVTTYKEIQ